MAEQRFVPRQGLTKEEISKLSDEELVSRLPDQVKKFTFDMTKMSFTKAGEERLPGESEGARRRRVRDNREIDSQEFALALRKNLEGALFDSKAEKEKRMADVFSADITAECRKARRGRSEAEGTGVARRLGYRWPRCGA